MPFLAFLAFTLCGAVLILALPVLAPVLAWLEMRSRRRLRMAAALACCRRCGHRLGQPALDRAEAAWRAELACLDPMTRHVIPRVVRRLYASCPACGAAHGWDERHRSFPLLPDD